MILRTQTIILLVLIPVLLVVTVGMAFIIYSDLYQAILSGFDKKLFAISTATGSFIDGDIHSKITESKRIMGLAFDPTANTLYGINAADGYLVTIDPETGGALEIGATGFSSIEELALDSKTGNLYGLDSTQGQLVAIDPLTGVSSTLGTVGTRCFGLAFDPTAGMLYGGGNQLVKINTVTGKGTVVGSLGFEDVRGLAFDAKTGTLYGTDNRTNQLISIDTERGAAKSIGALVQSSGESPADSEEESGESEETPFKLPSFGLAFDPNTHTLYGTTDRLMKIDTGTGQVDDFGSEGYRSEENPCYLKYVEPMRRIKGKFNVEEKTNPKKRDLWFLYSQVLGDAGTAMTYILDAENPESIDFDEMHAPLYFTETTLDGDVPIEDAKGAGDVMVHETVYIGKVEYWDNWKVTLKSAYAPIFNERGEPKGMAGADVNVNRINQKTREALQIVIAIGALSLLLAGGVAFYITRKLIEPIRQLKEGALKVAAGEYGYQIPVQGVGELGQLSIAFNDISQVLKETIEDVTQANQDLEARRSQQELIRMLAQAADDERFPRPDVLAHSRLGGKSHYRDSSGWAHLDGTFLLWLADSPEDSLQAVKLRRDTSIVVNRLLREFSGDWNAISAKLKNLFEDSVYCFALLDPSSNFVRFLPRRPLPVVLVDERKEVCRRDFAQDESMVLSPGQILILSSTNWIAIPNGLAKFEELTRSVDTDASRILSALEKGLMDLSLGPPSTGELPVEGILTVMVGKVVKTTPKDVADS